MIQSPQQKYVHVRSILPLQGLITIFYYSALFYFKKLRDAFNQLRFIEVGRIQPFTSTLTHKVEEAE